MTDCSRMAPQCKNSQTSPRTRSSRRIELSFTTSGRISKSIGRPRQGPLAREGPCGGKSSRQAGLQRTRERPAVSFIPPSFFLRMR